MTRSHPRWLLPFVFAGAAIGHAPSFVEPRMSPALAAVAVGGVTFVAIAAAIVATLVFDPPPDLDELAGGRHQDPNPARRRTNPKERRYDTPPFLIVAAIAAITIAAIATQGVGSDPRTPAEPHAPIVLNPTEPVGPRIVHLAPDGWRIAEWERRCVDELCTAVECRPLGFVSGDWSDDGFGLFVVTLLGGEPDPQAVTPGEIAAAKKECRRSAIEGCCPAWQGDPAPPCSDYCGYSYEVVLGTGGSGIHNCQALKCKFENGGVCPPPLSWGGQKDWTWNSLAD